MRPKDLANAIDEVLLALPLWVSEPRVGIHPKPFLDGEGYIEILTGHVGRLVREAARKRQEVNFRLDAKHTCPLTGVDDIEVTFSIRSTLVDSTDCGSYDVHVNLEGIFKVLSNGKSLTQELAWSTVGPITDE